MFTVEFTSEPAQAGTVSISILSKIQEWNYRGAAHKSSTSITAVLISNPPGITEPEPTLPYSTVTKQHGARVLSDAAAAVFFPLARYTVCIPSSLGRMMCTKTLLGK